MYIYLYLKLCTYIRMYVSIGMGCMYLPSYMCVCDWVSAWTDVIERLDKSKSLCSVRKRERWKGVCVREREREREKERDENVFVGHCPHQIRLFWNVKIGKKVFRKSFLKFIKIKKYFWKPKWGNLFNNLTFLTCNLIWTMNNVKVANTYHLVDR